MCYLVSQSPRQGECPIHPSIPQNSGILTDVLNHNHNTLSLRTPCDDVRWEQTLLQVGSQTRSQDNLTSFSSVKSYAPCNRYAWNHLYALAGCPLSMPQTYPHKTLHETVDSVLQVGSCVYTKLAKGTLPRCWLVWLLGSCHFYQVSMDLGLSSGTSLTALEFTSAVLVLFVLEGWARSN